MHLAAARPEGGEIVFRWTLLPGSITHWQVYQLEPGRYEVEVIHSSAGSARAELVVGATPGDSVFEMPYPEALRRRR